MILSVWEKGGFSMLAWERGDLRHPETEIIPELLVRTVAGVKTACFRHKDQITWLLSGMAKWTQEAELALCEMDGLGSGSVKRLVVLEWLERPGATQSWKCKSLGLQR